MNTRDIAAYITTMAREHPLVDLGVRFQGSGTSGDAETAREVVSALYRDRLNSARGGFDTSVNLTQPLTHTTTTFISTAIQRAAQEDRFR